MPTPRSGSESTDTPASAGPSPWSPPSAGRAARRAALATSPGLAAARRADALLTLAARGLDSPGGASTPGYWSPPPGGASAPATPSDAAATEALAIGTLSCPSSGGTPRGTPAAPLPAPPGAARVLAAAAPRGGAAAAAAQAPTPAGGLSRDIRVAMSVRAAACTRYAALQTRRAAAAAEPALMSPDDARTLADARAAQAQARARARAAVGAPACDVRRFAR